MNQKLYAEVIKPPSLPPTSNQRPIRELRLQFKVAITALVAGSNFRVTEQAITEGIQAATGTFTTYVLKKIMMYGPAGDVKLTASEKVTSMSAEDTGDYTRRAAIGFRYPPITYVLRLPSLATTPVIVGQVVGAPSGYVEVIVSVDVNQGVVTT